MKAAATKEQRALARIFRAAARLIERNENDGERACAAIWRVQELPESHFGTRDYRTPAHLKFEEFFQGRHTCGCPEEFGIEPHSVGSYCPRPIRGIAAQRAWWYRHVRAPEAFDHRIVALCLLAAMADAGDL